jgi:hypothetical protein
MVMNRLSADAALWVASRRRSVRLHAARGFIVAVQQQPRYNESVEVAAGFAAHKARRRAVGFTACLLHLLHWWIQPRASALGFFL